MRIDLSQGPLICLITKGDAEGSNLSDKRTEILSIVKAAVDAGISMVQIREKRLTGRALFELASDAVKISGQTRTILLVNDRADVALAARADGVHLTRASLSPALISQNFPSDFLIGASTHSLAASEAAVREGADFVTFGPVFESPGKGPAVGLDELGRVCASLAPFPVLALGGIDKSNYAATVAHGASGFAAIRFLNDIDNLRRFTRKTA